MNDRAALAVDGAGAAPVVLKRRQCTTGPSEFVTTLTGQDERLPADIVRIAADVPREPIRQLHRELRRQVARLAAWNAEAADWNRRAAAQPSAEDTGLRRAAPLRREVARRPIRQTIADPTFAVATRPPANAVEADQPRRARVASRCAGLRLIDLFPRAGAPLAFEPRARADAENRLAGVQLRPDDARQAAVDLGQRAVARTEQSILAAVVRRARRRGWIAEDRRQRLARAALRIARIGRARESARTRNIRSRAFIAARRARFARHRCLDAASRADALAQTRLVELTGDRNRTAAAENRGREQNDGDPVRASHDTATTTTQRRLRPALRQAAVPISCCSRAIRLTAGCNRSSTHS